MRNNMNNLPLRSLLVNEIRSIVNEALPKGGNRNAIENFLMTVAANKTVDEAAENLNLDADQYSWSLATVEAICNGIMLAADMVE
jgi:hypothetical protein